MPKRDDTRRRRLACLAILAMLLRLCLPLLHGGESCAHRHAAGVEVCSCGVAHAHAPTAPNGQQDADERESHACLACQLEDEAPGGAPLQVQRTLVEAPASAPVAAARPSVVAARAQVAPPPRGPPEPSGT